MNHPSSGIDAMKTESPYDDIPAIEAKMTIQAIMSAKDGEFGDLWEASYVGGIPVVVHTKEADKLASGEE